MNPKVSVIIPVYNAEEYLEECIKSLINQTLKECEFIFINDGSTDSSLTILNIYKTQDSRIIVVSQKNQGVSAARNAGIGLAKGDYIGFVDADDYVDTDYFEKMFQSAINKKCKIVISDWSTTIDGYESKSNLSIPNEVIINKNEIINIIMPLFIKNDSFNSIWNKIYNSYLIKSNKISFPVGMKLGEDRIFNIRAFTKAESCIYIDYCGYHYREVDASATHNLISNDCFKSLLEEYNENVTYMCNLSDKEIAKFKAEKFIKRVISLTYISFSSKDSMKNRYCYVSSMINNEIVQNVTSKYRQTYTKHCSRYERAVFKCIENRNTLGIYFLTLYSRLKNRKEVEE